LNLGESVLGGGKDPLSTTERRNEPLSEKAEENGKALSIREVTKNLIILSTGKKRDSRGKGDKASELTSSGERGEADRR